MTHNFDTRAPTARELMEKERRTAHLEDIRSLLKSKAGRRYIWDALAKCHIMHSSFDGANMHMTAYREGRRSIGLELFGDLMEADPSAYDELRREQAKVAQEDAATLKRLEEGEEENG